MDTVRGSLIIFVAAFAGAGAAVLTALSWAGLIVPPSFWGGSAPYCNVLKVPIYGEMVTVRPMIQERGGADSEETNGDANILEGFTVSTEVEETLHAASEDPGIKALLVDVDSGGGGPVAGVEVANAISRFGKPSVAVVHEVGASSAYLAAAAADVIFAAEESAVGSIGVTGSYADQSKKNEKEGITFHQLSSAPFKDIYSPDKPLTDIERARIMQDIKMSHDNFVRDVAMYRSLPVEKVATLADGWALLGKAALDAGLIDRIGGTEEATLYIEEKIGEPAVVCL
ncbi:S49 family peptidase [Candidatus Kaiserbacteria bacterium]|nr:S49 family peptidase [Candidatus Kaiserbacteria bacterium]